MRLNEPTVYQIGMCIGGRTGGLRARGSRFALYCLTAVVCVLAGSASAGDLNIAGQFFAAEGAVSVGEAEGQPPAAPIRADDGRLLGYAFSTRSVSGSVGYSGRPIDIVAAVTPEGIIAGARIVAHEEPILVIGVPRQALRDYVADFAGFDVGAAARVQPSRPSGRGSPDAVAGATVTSSVIRDAILRSARAVLRARTAAAHGGVRLDRTTLGTLSWPALVADGALQHLSVTRGEAARLIGTRDPQPDKPFIDLWLALATPPVIGESLLGKQFYESELGKLGPEGNLLFIGASGLYSFKGTAWRRSGVFDRVEIVQGSNTFRLHATDHSRVDDLQAEGAPQLRETGLFRLPQKSGFDATRPFRLDLALSAGASITAAAPVVSLEYRIPDRYLIGTRPAPSAQAPQAAMPAEEAPLWQDIWWSRRLEIAALAAMLAALSAILIFQNAVTARGQFYYRLRASFLIVTLLFLGVVANAQLSVVNVLTFFHAILSGFRWELFLLDPMVFILWCFVAVSLLFWGRGVFCGWLCPFGALHELTNTIAQRLGVKQIDVPFGLHERLWMIKYVVFLAILAISLNSIMAAFTAAEIEPFKTAITMKFMRDWPFVVYAGLLLAVGLFIERFFCRYLCPLGAALAIPARLRMFEWLKRYRECGAECNICARNCTVQAIHPLGQINPNECIYCLKCQAQYFDESVCLHLKKRIERRRPRATSQVAASITTRRETGAN